MPKIRTKSRQPKHNNMKKIILVMAVALTGFATMQAQDCTTCRPAPVPGTTLPLALADLTIEKLNVNSTAGKCKAKITVKNLQDDTSYETQLVVTLPIETTFMSATGAGTTNRQCGNTVIFCLGEINPGVSKEVTVETSEIINTFHLKQETFGAFVHGSTPDGCPVNNFKSWVNTGVSEDCRRFRHVKTERDAAE